VARGDSDQWPSHSSHTENSRAERVQVSIETFPPRFPLASGHLLLGIAFANVDLSGMPDYKSSIIEADRAVGQLLECALS
jgi:hypothetical protein